MIGDIPIIKTFASNKECYVYDAYTNRLLGVGKEIYCELCKLQKLGIAEYRKLGRTDRQYTDVIDLLDKGLFKSSFIERIEHPDAKYLREMIDRCINQLILGITSSCNFKCRYCHQAEGKGLALQKMMDKETAFKSVDFLYEHSKDAFEVTITFYGGEPLLNFDLIKSTVGYAVEKIRTKNIVFNMTTNASLINEEIADFLAANNFVLLISLDGDEKTQDKHRRYLKNGEGTFNSVWKNVLYIRDKYPEYFNSNVSFNAVVLQDENPINVLRFFKENNISETSVTIRRADMNGIDYYVSSISLKNGSDDERLEGEMYKDFFERLSDKKNIPPIWHHNGPCVPAVRRLFVNADGEFYPCEKIDSDPSCLIGTLNNGINIEKADVILNIGRLTEQECKSCWALRFCTICVHNCINSGTWSRFMKLKSCEIQKKNAVAFLKKYAESRGCLL